MPKLFSIPRIQQIPRSGKSAALAALTCLGLSQSLQAESACLGAPPLAAPTGTVVNVSSAQELNSAINNLSDNTTILLEPGDYSLVSTLYIRRSNITLRGNSDSCDAVVLRGKGMENRSYGDVPHGIWSDATNLKIQNLSIQEVYFHPIILNPGAQSPEMYNLKLLNAGEQFIKSNAAVWGNGVNNGKVEYVIMEYTDGPPLTDHGGGGTGYTNGVDVHAGDNWIIRNNLFKDFHVPDFAQNRYNPAILMWRGANNTMIDNNVFINVDRGIALGLENDGNGGSHSGGWVRNNMIYLEPGLMSASRRLEMDGAIIIWDSANTAVEHNTCITNGNVNNCIEFRWDTQGSTARNNLIDTQIGSRGGAPFTASNNIFVQNTNIFENPGAADLHIKASAATGAYEVPRLANVLTDFDGDARQSTTLAGADVPGDDTPVSPPQAPSSVSATILD